MKLKETFVYKGRDGYQAETLTETDANGKVWNITTHKGRDRVYCSASQGEDSGNGAICYNLSNMMGGDNNTYFSNLASEDGVCNEAKVKRVHEAGIKAFLERVATLPEAVKPYTIEPGQIVFDNHGSRTTRVIYATERPGHYKAVDLEGTRTENISMIETSDYTEGNILPMEKVNELVNRAHAAQRERQEKAEKAATLAAIERNQKIAAGIKILPAIPEGVQAVIVAKFRVNDSDIQTDYFAAHTEKEVFLAWSTHTRDIFSELRKAAAKFEETKQYSTPPAKPAEASEYWTPEDEHREKYSMGAGYYLGESKYHGWIVEKDRIGQYGPTLETLQIAAAEGRFFCNVEPEPTNEPTPPQYEAQEVTPGTVQIIEHPIRKHKVLVVGDTKPIKETLKTIKGAWWNRFEKGWEFKRDQIGEIEKALKNLRKPEPTPDPETIQPEPTEDEAQAIQEEERAPLQIAEHSEPRHPEHEPAHPLNLCDPDSSQYREALQEDTAKNYDSLEEIEEAANSGQVISLYNLHELVNKKTARVKEASAKVEPSQAAAAMREAAEKLNTMADDHTAKMQTIRAEIAEEVQKIKEIGEPKQQFCTPTPAPAFFTANVTPEEANDREFIESLPEGTGDGHGYTHKPAFFRENGATTAAEQRAQANTVKLYSEHREGTNTGRAQQGFLF